MATDFAQPPSYAEHTAPNANFEETLPDYSRVAAADERIMQSQPRARSPGPSSSSTVEHIFTSERLELNMGPKKYPVKVPCYGWHGVVEGKVTVKDFKAAEKITITLEGVCTSAVTERGVAAYSSTKTLVFMPRILWTRSTSPTVPDGPEDFAFSFQLPTNVQGTPLPHSYATAHIGFNADVTYQVTVDLFRKGLRRHERLKTMILYLPRSTPPEAPFQRHHSWGEQQDVVEWESIPIYPRVPPPVPGKNKAKEIQVEQNPAEAINLILPLPKAYASASPIPFHLSFPGDSPLLSYIFSHLSVQLIKYNIIRTGGFLSIRDGIIGVGEIHQIDDGSYPTPPPSPSLEQQPPTVPRKVYSGTLKSFRDHGETSWNMPQLLEIRYVIRVRVRPPEGQSEKKLPDYLHDQPVLMCTHNRIPNAEDINEPVIGLIAVAGSQGAPTNRPVPANGLRA